MCMCAGKVTLPTTGQAVSLVIFTMLFPVRETYQKMQRNNFLFIFCKRSRVNISLEC